MSKKKAAINKRLARLGYKVDIFTRRFEDQPAIEHTDEAYCNFTSRWVDKIYGSEFHRTDGGVDMFYTGPFYNGKYKEERRRMILSYVPHSIGRVAFPFTGYHIGICRICLLPYADHPA